MTLRPALRTIAIAIAAAALRDPACAVERLRPARLGVIVAESPTLDLPASSTDARTRRDDAVRLRDHVVAALSAAAEIDTRPSSDQQALIVIGDRAPIDLSIDADTTVSTLQVGEALSPNVAAESLDVPATVRVGGRVPITVTLHGSGAAGRTSTVTLGVGALRLGSQTHTWPDDESRAVVAFEVIPWKEGPLPLRATVTHAGPEATTVDNIVDAATMAHATSVRVLVLDARPSWGSRFVARALERDPQAIVASRTVMGRGVSVRAGWEGAPGGLTPARMDAYDVVVVSSPDAESPETVAWLDAFMRVRGGAVVVLADASSALNATKRWWPLAFRERSTAAPVAIAAVGPRGLTWRATEFAAPGALPPTMRVLAATTGDDPQPVVVAQAVGLGRLVANTALDAWRFRGDDGSAFAAFWRGVVIGLADDVVLPVAIGATASAGRPGDVLRVSVRLRPSMPPGGDAAQPPGGAYLAGASASGPIQLWPSAEDGVFEGTRRLPSTDADYLVGVTARGGTARAAVHVAESARPAVAAPLPLAWLAAAHGGTATTAADVDALVPPVRRHLEAARRRETVILRPMRSPWWIVPFAIALGIEWTARRRLGLR